MKVGDFRKNAEEFWGFVSNVIIVDLKMNEIENRDSLISQRL